MPAARERGEARGGAAGAGHAAPAAWLRTFSLALSRLTEERESRPCLPGQRSGMFALERRLLLDALLMGWGLGTWLGVNGIYNQLPLLVERLPEGWALPASMVLAVQLGNVGLLLYALLRRLLPSVSQVPYIYGLLVIGLLALVLNSFLYEITATIGKSETSVVFLFFTFCVALVGCTSSILFYPYMSHFKDIYLTTYLFGEGLSGFVPSMFALIQGVGGEIECRLAADNKTMETHYPEALFGTNAFFLMLSALAALSLACFACIDLSGKFADERVTKRALDKREEAAPASALMTVPWALMMLMMLLLSALSSAVMPSIQTYSCMPYGTRAYHLAVTLCQAANPVALLMGVLLPPLRLSLLVALLASALPALGYMLATALLSPLPPLLGQDIGAPLIVVTWVWATLGVSYARMWVFVWARRGGARGMRACGAAGQLGSTSFSLLFYALVNYTALFSQPDICVPLLH